MNNNYFYKLASVADRIDWMRKVADVFNQGPTSDSLSGQISTLQPLDKRSLQVSPGVDLSSNNSSTINAGGTSTQAANSAGTGKPGNLNYSSVNKNGLGAVNNSVVEQVMAPQSTAPTISLSDTPAESNSVPASAPELYPESAAYSAPGPGDVDFVPKNATELYNHWVAQKENFYRKRAEDPNDKFGSRYANYTVSREAQKGLEREAKDLFDRFNRGDINQADLERYFTREGAFNSAMDRYEQERIDRKKPQEQSARAPMQNPTATSAIPNSGLNYSNTGSPTQQNLSTQPANAPGQQDLSMHTPRAGSIIRQNGLPAYAQTFQDMQKFSEAWIKQYGYNPDSLSSASREYREAMRQYGSKLYPYYPGMTSFSQYAQDSINNGVGIYGDAQDRIKQLNAAYIDSKYFPTYSYGPGWEQALQNYIGHKDNPWNQYSYF